MLSQLPLSLVALLSHHAFALAAAPPLPPPTTRSTPPSGQSMTLSRRSQWNRRTEEWGAWDKNQREVVAAKYGGGTISKRSTGTNLLVDQSIDSSYYGSLAIGTPAVSYNVILDTGSADMWIADNSCTTGCSSIETFDASASTTFTNDSTSFSVTYGSGKASGSLGQDVVQIAGFSVPNQVFGLADDVSAGMLNPPTSGLLGLAWQTLSSTNSPPIWETLVSEGAWDSPIMAFHLTRFLNDSTASSLEAGGSFTMGFVNQSLYTGDIEYINIPDGQAKYWTLPLTTLTVQGNDVTLSSGSSSYAIIDTGTTLVGGPAAQIADIFAQIPDSYAAGGDYEGYYAYPCGTEINVSLSFGGQSWAISPADFQLRQVSRATCIGAFFVLSTGTGTPPWIIGDTFLKNVLAVFRYDPPSVGFAQLSAVALQYNGGDEPVPTPTIGAVTATVSAKSGVVGMWASATLLRWVSLVLVLVAA